MVTGAGPAIGRAAALALLEEGYSVVLAGRRREALEETAALAGAGRVAGAGRAHGCGRPRRRRRSFDATREDLRPAGPAVQQRRHRAAGDPPGRPGRSSSGSGWSNVNLTGAFLCTQAAFRLMKAQDPRGGRIINNGSISATAPRPNSAPYTATKHAITGLTKSTALDGRKYDIACGQIDIGNAATEMTARMKDGVLQAGGEMAAEPTMDVSHVARAVVYMASLPLDANVLFLTVMATKMPFVGRG